MAQATYSAAALAAAVGVPRTTINDWLSRYEDYIDSISVGKRKVYSEESLKILQEIASLRDSGKSSAEIEAVLAGKHGVKPEVASEEPSRTAVSAEPAPAAAPEAENKTANNVTNDESSQLPAIREFEKNAMELTAFIAELRNQQLRSRSRSRWTILLLMLLIAVLLAGLSGLYHALKAQEAQRQLEAVKMQQEFRKLNEDFTAELKQQNELRIREREEAARNAGKLQSELLKLHKERASEAAKLEEKLAASRAAFQQQLAEQQKIMSEKSAADRAALLKQMESDSQRAEQQLLQLKNSLVNANKELQNMQSELIELKKRPPVIIKQSVPAPAVTPAPAVAPAPAEKQEKTLQ